MTPNTLQRTQAGGIFFRTPRLFSPCLSLSLVSLGDTRATSYEPLRHPTPALAGFACRQPTSRGRCRDLSFRSVVAARDTLVATLPQGRRWLVQVGSSEPRLSEPGESFTIHAGTSLRLIERHASYLVTAQATAPAGLQVEHTSDARSVGGEVTKKSFFIPAH